MENNFGKFYAGNFTDRDTNAMHIEGSEGGGVEELGTVLLFACFCFVFYVNLLLIFLYCRNFCFCIFLRKIKNKTIKQNENKNQK